MRIGWGFHVRLVSTLYDVISLQPRSQLTTTSLPVDDNLGALGHVRLSVLSMLYYLFYAPSFCHHGNCLVCRHVGFCFLYEKTKSCVILCFIRSLKFVLLLGREIIIYRYLLKLLPVSYLSNDDYGECLSNEYAILWYLLKRAKNTVNLA